MTIVKICGLTRLEDALAAQDAGADLLGFICYPQSPRYVTQEQAASIVAGVRQRAAQTDRRAFTVGVFVNASASDILETLAACRLDLAQLHGHETPHTLELLDRRGFKALRPSSIEEAAADAEWFAGLAPPDGPDLLLDTYHPQAYGGSGTVADWSIAAALVPQFRILLAGGLTPANVAAAVRRVRPWGVDVSSGVEEEPGQKDREKVRAFVHEAKREGLRRRGSPCGCPGRMGSGRET